MKGGKRNSWDLKSCPWQEVHLSTAVCRSSLGLLENVWFCFKSHASGVWCNKSIIAVNLPDNSFIMKCLCPGFCLHFFHRCPYLSQTEVQFDCTDRKNIMTIVLCLSCCNSNYTEVVTLHTEFRYNDQYIVEVLCLVPSHKSPLMPRLGGVQCL